MAKLSPKKKQKPKLVGKVTVYVEQDVFDLYKIGIENDLDMPEFWREALTKVPRERAEEIKNPKRD
jgi:hypothetical protein